MAASLLFQDRRWSDCAPPDNFSKRFPALSERRGIRRVTRRITYASPNVLKSDNAVTGAEVTSNNLYAHKFLGVAGYGRDHTYAAIVQLLGSARRYQIRISDTEYTKGSRAYFMNELTELHVPYRDGLVVVPRTGRWEEGYCEMPNVNGPPPSCFNTAIGSFEIDQELFEYLAARDPALPIEIGARKSDGTTAACPYYFSPLSFKAPMLTIDDAYGRALAKRARQNAR